MIETIENTLDTLWFYIWDPSWEFSEKQYLSVVEEIQEAIQDDWPENIPEYITSYVKKNYEFNI